MDGVQTITNSLPLDVNGAYMPKQPKNAYVEAYLSL